MATFQESISSAVKTQAARKNIQSKDLAEAMGLSRTSFWRRLTNQTAWTSEDFGKLATALGLGDAWALINLAKEEELIDLTNARMA